ncbi:MAG: hypothetical protein ACFFER_07635 [Candidatus Thorarchaeota archaeon]
MKIQNRALRALYAIILIGGIFELVMGFVILLAGDIVISISGGSPIPVFQLYWRTMGLLAIALGSLQIHASRDIARYVAIPIAASCVRLLLPILTYLQLLDSPTMGGALVISTAFDFFLAVVTLVLLYRVGLLGSRA